MTLKRTVKQGWEDRSYEEEDYQYLKEKMEAFKSIHAELEAVYSTRSINAMVERLEKEEEDLEVKPLADKVSIHGMFDCHLFKKYEAASVAELIDAWYRDLTIPHMRGGNDMGPPALCPAIVMSGTTELRRVGNMVHQPWGGDKPDEVAVETYRKALTQDPDIPRLLREQYAVQ